MVAKSRGTDGFTLGGSGEGQGSAGDTPGGNGDGVSNIGGAVDPASLAPGDANNGTGANPAKRGRGRPKGSGNAKAASASLDIGGVETILFNIHGMVAAATGFDKLALAQEEANSLAKAVNNVRQFYPMHVSAKALAWSNLFMVAGTVYGSRIIAIWAAQKAKETQPATNDVNVHVLKPLGM
jgi:hypothetical protein